MTLGEEIAALAPAAREAVERVLSTICRLRELDRKHGFTRNYHSGVISKVRERGSTPLTLALDARMDSFAPGVDLTSCRVCGLRGKHECLRGDARAGMGQWKSDAWRTL